MPDKNPKMQKWYAEMILEDLDRLKSMNEYRRNHPEDWPQPSMPEWEKQERALTGGPPTRLSPMPTQTVPGRAGSPQHVLDMLTNDRYLQMSEDDRRRMMIQELLQALYLNSLNTRKASF